MHHLFHTAVIVLAIAEGVPFLLGSLIFGTIGYKAGKRRR